MRKLLDAEIRRLFLSRVFRIVAFLSFLLAGALQVLNYYQQVKYESERFFDAMVFFPFVIMGFVLVIPVALFVGAEYSDGTLRNKIIAGHSKVKLYFTYLMVSELAAVLWLVAFWVGFTLVGLPLLGTTFVWTPVEIASHIGIYLLTMLAYISIYLLILFASQNKTLTAVLGLILAIFLWFAAVAIHSRLSEPPSYDDVQVTNDYKVENIQRVKNPDYLTGDKRKTYELMERILPSGQSILLSGGYNSGTPDDTMPLFSLAIVVVSSLGSIVLFKKKDMK